MAREQWLKEFYIRIVLQHQKEFFCEGKMTTSLTMTLFWYIFFSKVTLLRISDSFDKCPSNLQYLNTPLKRSEEDLYWENSCMQ